MIPPAITAELAALRAATKAAAPLNSASSATLVGLQSQAEMLATTISTTIPNAAGTLDGADPAGMPPVIVAQFKALFGFALDQRGLVDMLGFVSRAATNLNQIGI